MERIIVVEDNLTFSGYVCRLLESKGFQTVSTSTCNGARKLFAKMREDDIVLADMRLPDGDGLLEMSLPPLLKNLRERMARHETPIYERQSVAFREIDHKIRLVAPTNMGVLVLGENGTGKEHIAEKIHTMSKRAGKPFVAVDCGLLSKELAASALFGHEKGAFTGADTKRKGYWEEADGGTLFLDEIGNLPLEVQQMMLRPGPVRDHAGSQALGRTCSSACVKPSVLSSGTHPAPPHAGAEVKTGSGTGPASGVGGACGGRGPQPGRQARGARWERRADGRRGRTHRR